ncbi:hypothetical protein [Williamsia sp.]|uniref:hypothetical protein n=1 Tax=Williamsia sp. TaxID=1872085 RepID=UPI002F923063
MTLGVSQVRGWDLASMTVAADGAATDAETFEEVALTVTNAFTGVQSDWNGEARDLAEVQVADQASSLNDRATRWRTASDRLRTAAEQLGLLKAEIERLVDDAASKTSMVGPIYIVADDGSVSVSPAFVALYAASTPPAGPDVLGEAEAMALQLQALLKRLLTNAAVAAEYYDWQITNALLGLADNERPFKPSYIPAPPPKPTGPRSFADRGGHGPNSYNVDDPGLMDSTYMAGLRFAALTGANRSEPLAPVASDMLRHYFGNSGAEYRMDVGALLQMPRFGAESDGTAVSEFVGAREALPPGYIGPVVFEGAYTDQSTFRPLPQEGLDALGALGGFSYQTSGVAVPTDNGYSIDYKTSVYDYYDWDPTDQTFSEQYSDLNDMHRAGWAQNFEVVGRSGLRETEWRP